MVLRRLVLFRVAQHEVGTAGEAVDIVPFVLPVRLHDSGAGKAVDPRHFEEFVPELVRAP